MKRERDAGMNICWEQEREREREIGRSRHASLTLSIAASAGECAAESDTRGRTTRERERRGEQTASAVDKGKGERERSEWKKSEEMRLQICSSLLHRCSHSRGEDVRERERERDAVHTRRECSQQCCAAKEREGRADCVDCARDLLWRECPVTGEREREDREGRSKGKK